MLALILLRPWDRQVLAGAPHGPHLPHPPRGAAHQPLGGSPFRGVGRDLDLHGPDLKG